MLTSISQAHVTVTASELADWIDQQSDHWWFIDGDPILVPLVDVPCPSDELAQAIREVGKRVLIYDSAAAATPRTKSFDISQLDELADRENNRRERNFLCAWEGTELEWILIDDTEAAETFSPLMV